MGVAHGSAVETVAAIISRRYTTFGGHVAETLHRPVRHFDSTSSVAPVGHSGTSPKVIINWLGPG